MTLQIQRQTAENVANSLAAYLPNDRLWESKLIEGTNLRALMKGLSELLFDAECFLNIYSTDFIPTNTVYFVEDWEQALQIPDGCFDINVPIEIRRRNILIKLASLGVQTIDDFRQLALLFDVTVTIQTAIDTHSFPLVFPFVFTDVAEDDAPYTIIVSFTDVTPAVFPLTFPIIFGNSDLVTLQCLFEQLIPTNCQVVFQEAPPIPPTEVNFTDDTYWETRLAFAGLRYTWDTGLDPDSWVTDDGFQIFFGLKVIESGINIGWEIGFRPAAVRIITNSGPSADFGEAIDTVITLRNGSGDTLMSETLLFTTSNQEIEFTATLNFAQAGPSLDIQELIVDTFLYNTGPRISLIEFIL